MRYGLLVTAVFSSWLLFGQTPSGELKGTVSGPSGSALSGATVTLTGAEPGVTRKAEVAADGSFSITDLPVGNYRVELTDPGGTRRMSQPIRIEAGSRSTLALTFAPEVGSPDGPIEVEGRAPSGQAESAEVSRAYGTVLVNWCRSCPAFRRLALTPIESSIPSAAGN
jgi:Carboxypeptidase regulatory-like domain